MRHIGFDDLLKVRALKEGHLTMGPDIEAFEQAIKEYVGRDYAVAVTNGTAALHISLMALGISEGDEVLLPASVCPALLLAIEHVNATPIFCDVNKDDLNISFDYAKEQISEKTKAIMLPHLFGMSSDIDAFETLDIPLIEDSAQSLGGTYKGKKQGAFGELSVFSFYATKMMTSVDGGMVLTDDEGFADYMCDVCYYGGKHEYSNRFNYKLQNLNAAIGLAQLKKLDQYVQDRRIQFENIKQHVTNWDGIDILQGSADVAGNSCYKALLKFKDDHAKAKFLELAHKHQVNVSNAIFKDLAAYRNGVAKSAFENLSQHIEYTRSFPIYPGIDQRVIDKFLDSVDKVFEVAVS